ncbi:natural cytotoxicity triggering receptor 3 ligand 1-like isoform X2 [Alexandromys fortis]|uniref:natural cytotoxicity triggering receptor 3 ligand 1-like isoform X2 n=1 Tax=Alexandromys fortis TaxID=100897 RepID=UPI002153214B|nr:natural cytotoxicity triggering receptor 3 ligand 1-like isoform X2 [Microtus fortis]XP_049999224.1 natural cytotoxicity triggering receptor 3 ligand 1-like isoform X2 [Microtus fortis]
MASSWVAEWQDGYMASLVLVLLWCMPIAGGLEVDMAGMTQMVFLHDNVTITCKIPGSPRLDIDTVGIIWFVKNELNKSEVKVFEFYGNHTESFRPGATVPLLGLESGDASLHLPEVQLWEAGEYRCMLVVTPDKAEGKTMLEVVACPTIRLFVKPSTVRNDEEEHIICELDGFYPEAFSIKWGKYTLKDSQFQEITEGHVTGPTLKNDDGTFNVSSYLTLKPSLEDHGTTYQCVVLHRSLLVPKRLNVTLSEEGAKDVRYAFLAFLVLLFPAAYALWRWRRQTELGGAGRQRRLRPRLEGTGGDWRGGRGRRRQGPARNTESRSPHYN